MRKKKVVLTGGVFDVLHAGHIYTLAQAKKYGDKLVVVVANDDYIRKKGREPIHTQEYRAFMVKAIRYVDEVILGGKNPEDIIKKVKPDVIVYGYDQKPFINPKGVKIVKLKKHIEKNNLKTSNILKKLGL
ncbi:MAG: adenylyltransferase/cytidyltransferase family protein [Candidatus Bilamarchaeaceae archaeon]